MRQKMELKQTVKPKLTVRTRLIYAAAGITIMAIITATVVFIYSNLGTSKTAQASAVAGDYRSITSGNWNNVLTWQRFNGTTWVAAIATPTSSNGVITIQSGNTVTITTGVAVDQVVINSGGEVDLNSGVTLSISNGAGNDLDVTGIFKSAGTLSVNTNVAIVFENGGKYCHNRDGGNIPNSTWNTGSTCEILGITTNKPGNLDQAFYNFTWNCTGQTSGLDLNGVLQTVNGDLNLISTGTSFLQFDKQGNNLTLTIGGNLNVQGGTTYADMNGSVVLNVAGSYVQTGGNFNYCKAGGTAYGNYSTTINISGSMTISGGTMDMTQSSINNAIDGNGQVNLEGDLTLSSSGLITETSADSRGQVHFSGSSVQYFFSSSSNVTQKIDFTVDSGAILRLDNQVVYSAGNFNVLNGGGLMMGSSNGITSSGASGNVQVTGTRSFSTGGDYTYNGTTAQYTGSGLPATVHNLTLNNSAGLTLTNTVAVIIAIMVIPAAA